MSMSLNPCIPPFALMAKAYRSPGLDRLGAGPRSAFTRLGVRAGRVLGADWGDVDGEAHDPTLSREHFRRYERSAILCPGTLRFAGMEWSFCS